MLRRRDEDLVGNVIPMQIDSNSSSKVALLQYEPIGVVAAVSAFNHPLTLIVHQVAPAVATGCPAIVKPAAATPLSCQAIEILQEAGLPKGWAQMVLPRILIWQLRWFLTLGVAFFSFIGSSRVGWMLKSKLAPGTRFFVRSNMAASRPSLFRQTLT